ncbi:MAG: hypothetical protein ACXABY_15740 [Candidatus Thorarchaeota archaeon]|jgi:hypothetical protein
MTEEGTIEDNVAKGKGIPPKKEGFTVVGMGESDKDHPEITGEPSRGRGRPAKDQNFTVVGPGPEGEQGSQKSE